MTTHPYRRLLAMAAASFVSMYVLMYAMVDQFANARHNLNQVYMAGLMTAPMVALELVLMRGMYPKRKLNLALLAGSGIALLALLVLIREQIAIGDRQFLRSMIPHHASAILMCERAPVADPEIAALCESIVASQQAEIDQMRAMLDARR